MRLSDLAFDLEMTALDAGGRVPVRPGTYLLCRPRGGVNDTLVQIAKCWKYSMLRRRFLIVDTTRAGLRDPLDHYFEPNRQGRSFVLSLAPSLTHDLNSLECHPTALTGRIDSYKGVRTPGGILDEASGVRTTFDFSQPYDARLLVHEESGGGRGLGFLTQLRFRDEVAETIAQRLRSLPLHYRAIHIRNTDIDTDYETYFRSIKPELEGQDLLVCSDDRVCVEHARQFFAGNRVHTVSDIPDTGGKPLHKLRQGVRDNNLDAFTDLMAMSGADAILVPPPERGLTARWDGRPHISGFARLARDLGMHRRIQDTLMGDPDWRRRLG